ncbi:MAG: hypothetical protein A3F18_02290 [Legionellales bacterium RIFCSPHIGHO2_12_FULL_37_14]|nr:MAG: hypothetical protein A3F18_02290 [Legionellales bacterium RIFCSPHIGHO2_12_FULL_37_14]
MPVSQELTEPWKTILEYGRYAPSPHNMQPWLFQVEEDGTVTLMYDPKRLLPGTNPTGSFVYVAFGILHETMSIAAASSDNDVEFEYLSDNLTLDSNAIGPQPLAKIRLVKRTREETLNKQLIIDRQTSRLPYNSIPVAEEVMDELQAIAAQYKHKLEYTRDKKEVDWVIRLNADTMFYDMSNAKARNEVASWMRFTKKDALARKDGLAAYAMHVPGPIMWLFAHANWLFRIPFVYYIVRKLYERTMRGTAIVSWISGPFATQVDWINAGHMMARLWLTMTKNGVYLHPFGSVITNQEANIKMTEHFKNPNREHNLWMLTRLGYGEKPPVAQRRSLDDMLVKGNKFSFFSPSKEEEKTKEQDMSPKLAS